MFNPMVVGARAEIPLLQTGGPVRQELLWGEPVEFLNVLRSGQVNLGVLAWSAMPHMLRARVYAGCLSHAQTTAHRGGVPAQPRLNDMSAILGYMAWHYEPWSAVENAARNLLELDESGSWLAGTQPLFDTPLIRSARKALLSAFVDEPWAICARAVRFGSLVAREPDFSRSHLWEVATPDTHYRPSFEDSFTIDYDECKRQDRWQIECAERLCMDWEGSSPSTVRVEFPRVVRPVEQV